MEKYVPVVEDLIISKKYEGAQPPCKTRYAEEPEEQVDQRAD